METKRLHPPNAHGFSRNYDYICPGCKQCSAIEEVMSVETVVSKVNRIVDPKTCELEYEPMEVEGDVSETTYRCCNCGFVIGDDLDLMESIEDNQTCIMGPGYPR